MIGIAERHAQEASYLWERRDAAARSPTRGLDTLEELDERLEAHVDGLRVAGDGGLEAALAELGSDAAGDAFAAALLATERGDFEAMASALDAAAMKPKRARGLVAALAFAPYERAKAMIGPLLAAKSPVLRRLGLAASAAHRVDAGADLERALQDVDPALRARALRAVGELGRRDLLPALTAELDAKDEAIRFFATWSAALLGDATATGALVSFCRRESPFAEAACRLAALRAPDGPMWIRRFAERTGDDRSAFVGAGALGDPALVPWLFESMRAPELARAAAEAFSSITGIDLAAEKLAARAPEGFVAGPNDDPADARVAMDPDAGLPWPDVDALQTRWTRIRAGFPAGVRRWAGAPVDRAQAAVVLAGGTQRRREAAALELALLGPPRPLFPVRAPAARQRALLAGGG